MKFGFADIFGIFSFWFTPRGCNTFTKKQVKTGHRFFGDIFGKVWTDILYLVFVGISFIDLTLAFWEELEDYVKNDGGDDCGEEIVEDEEEVHLADVVGDG